VNDQFIGSRVCKNVEMLASNQNKNMQLFLNWQDFLITYNGNAKANLQLSLRKKIEQSFRVVFCGDGNRKASQGN
jgi:hypothetical protein